MTSIAIAGSGGAGVITTGQLLLKATAKAGYFGYAQRSFGPQIRGGESLSLLRFDSHEVHCQMDFYDLLVLLDTEQVERFSAEVPLSSESVVIIGNIQDEVPGFVVSSGATVIRMPFGELAEQTAEGGENIVAVGILANYLGLEREIVAQVVADKFVKKDALAQHAQGWLDAGWQHANTTELTINVALGEPAEHGPDWVVNGSDVCGYGAIKAGIRFVAAYPITPASGILEWLAPNLEMVNGSLIQAEDELASINMIIGASFGGIPSLTATSGPGLALMTESIGLAVSSETPIVVVNVMRGGPSTGIPTKSEQSDLNIALHGLHGDAPHVVTAMLSIADSAFTTSWSVWLAEHLQVPVISMSDQSLAQSDASIAEPELWPQPADRLVAAHADTPYERYALTADGISPMAIPGNEDMMYTADGLEHDTRGTPSAAVESHRQQLDKRAQKLAEFKFGDAWAEINGEGELCILCWGSLWASANEAAKQLRQQGKKVKVIAIRLVAPLRVNALREALIGVEKLVIVEQNHGAQFKAWLRAHLDIPCEHVSLALPGPLPIRPGQILAAFEQFDERQLEVKDVANC